MSDNDMLVMYVAALASSDGALERSMNSIVRDARKLVDSTRKEQFDMAGTAFAKGTV